MATPTCSLSCCSLPPIHQQPRKSLNPIVRITSTDSDDQYCSSSYWNQKNRQRSIVVRSSSGKKPDKPSSPIPSWADPKSEEEPPWARGESSKQTNGGEFQIPFYAYLLASAITAIAAIGSVFEYVNEKPIFGLLSADSVFYAPILGFFAITGIPTSAFLWYKSVEAANKDAEEQDRRDGFLK
ncbi:hypothetical protein LINPERPRIM_LOCUS24104 [Linum perenne]